VVVMSLPLSGFDYRWVVRAYRYDSVDVSLTGYRIDKGVRVSDVVRIWRGVYGKPYSTELHNRLWSNALTNIIKYVDATLTTYRVKKFVYDVGAVENAVCAQWADYHIDYLWAQRGVHTDVYLGYTIMNHRGFLMCYYWCLYLKSDDLYYLVKAYEQVRDWDLTSWFRECRRAHSQYRDVEQQLWAGHYDFMLKIIDEVNWWYMYKFGRHPTWTPRHPYIFLD